MLAIGGGYVNDIDTYQTRRTLGLLEAAVAEGIPAALVGQGIGPLTSPDLVAEASRVLPRVDLIGLREGRRAPALLERLGVPAERVVVTGDDAIELAARARLHRSSAQPSASACGSRTTRLLPSGPSRTCATRCTTPRPSTRRGSFP